MLADFLSTAAGYNAGVAMVQIVDLAVCAPGVIALCHIVAVFHDLVAGVALPIAGVALLLAVCLDLINQPEIRMSWRQNLAFLKQHTAFAVNIAAVTKFGAGNRYGVFGDGLSAVLLGGGFAPNLLIAMVTAECSFIAPAVAGACLGGAGDQGQFALVFPAALDDLAVEDHTIAIRTNSIAGVAIGGANGIAGILHPEAVFMLARLHNGGKCEDTAAFPAGEQRYRQRPFQFVAHSLKGEILGNIQIHYGVSGASVAVVMYLPTGDRGVIHVQQFFLCVLRGRKADDQLRAVDHRIAAGVAILHEHQIVVLGPLGVYHLILRCAVGLQLLGGIVAAKLTLLVRNAYLVRSRIRSGVILPTHLLVRFQSGLVTAGP